MSELEKHQLNIIDVREKWNEGNWKSLININIENIFNKEIKKEIMCFVAIAELEIENYETARNLIEKIIKNNNEKNIKIKKLLIASLNNSIGRANLILNNIGDAKKNFEEAIKLVDDNLDSEFIAEIKLVRELNRIGNTAETIKIVSSRINDLKEDFNEQTLKRIQARFRIIDAEIEIIQQQLSMSIQKHKDNFIVENTVNEKNNENQNWKKNLKKISPSQLNQDIWVLERTDYKRGGFFVEFGATDGVLLSNTWLLETHMDWIGICAEPNPKYYDRLKRNRQCKVTNACIGSRSGELVNFVLADEYGGLVKDMNRDMHKEKREAYFTEPANRTQFVSESLEDMLIRMGAPNEIDYLSIDTEGSELEILENFRFDRWKIRLITVEHNYSQDREKIYLLLTKNGYRCTEEKWDDWYELIK